MTETHSGHFLTDPIFGHRGMRACFGETAFVDAMVQTECALAQVQGTLGLIPADAARDIAGLSAEQIAMPELADGVASSGVPVPALVAGLRAQLSPQSADWLHFGATSQDIVDSAFCLCAGQGLTLLAQYMSGVIDRLQALSNRHADTVMLARTRGQLATPITFGLRAAHWAQPLIGLENALPQLCGDALRVQLGGASGSLSAFGNHGTAVAQGMAGHLGLTNAPPWHSDRSGVRQLAGWLAGLVTAAAKIGADVALSARGEVGELRLTQAGGSSTMPHKSNPVLAEAVQALVPIATACQAGLAAGAVHCEERDGSAWSVEWRLMPMLFETTGAAMSHVAALLDGLQVDAAAMQARVAATPAVWAEAAVFALAEKIGRVAAQDVVAQTLASGGSLQAALTQNGVDVAEQRLSDAGVTQPAKQVAARIFAARGATDPTPPIV